MSDLTDIYLSSRKLLSSIVSKIVPSSDVEDIVQDTFIKAQHAQKCASIAEPRAYMVTIAKNLARDYVKSARYRYSSDISNEAIEQIEMAGCNADRDELFNHIEHERKLEQFFQETQKLPEKCRKVYLLKKVYGYSQKEIAQSEGLAESTVEKHIAQGTKKMFYLMKEQQRNEASNKTQCSVQSAGGEA